MPLDVNKDHVIIVRRNGAVNCLGSSLRPMGVMTPKVA